jgi:hypothetical protein
MSLSIFVNRKGTYCEIIESICQEGHCNKCHAWLDWRGDERNE